MIDNAKNFWYLGVKRTKSWKPFDRCDNGRFLLPLTAYLFGANRAGQRSCYGKRQRPSQRKGFQATLTGAICAFLPQEGKS